MRREIVPFLDGRKLISVSLREPFDLDVERVHLSSPEPLPSPPQPINWMISLIPPAIMIFASFISMVLIGRNSIAYMVPMFFMSLGFPIANLMYQIFQNKRYYQTLDKRYAQYKEYLHSVEEDLQKLIQRQLRILEQEYPSLVPLVQIALAKGKNRRLWWRRRFDKDFLMIRIGNGLGKPALEIIQPHYLDAKDPIIQEIEAFSRKYQSIHNWPLTIDLKSIGSIVITGETPKAIHRFADLIIINLCVHHSPEDVQIGVITDKPDGVRTWEWIKWLPHTFALFPSHQKFISFDSTQGNKKLTELVQEYFSRRDRTRVGQEQEFQSLVLFFDDSGLLRRRPELSVVASDGYKYGIYLIFLGEKFSPNTSRSKVWVNEQGYFHFKETWNPTTKGREMEGVFEGPEQGDCERVARALAGLQPVSPNATTYTLPNIVRLSEILGDDPYSHESIGSNWKTNHEQNQMARFPIGYVIGPNGYEVLELDFRPESLGGLGEFNAFLIGAPGSGKSIFLQSLVLATAHKYSPEDVNFLLLDFKAGAAELAKIRHLPHVVGMVNELGPELAERALKAIENELARRKKIFEQVGIVTDIWDFNRRFPDKALPILLTIIDEFAAGVKLLGDQMIDRLDALGRQGRAFGMYFILANQEVNAYVEKLRPVVGWNIVLKVRRTEEMALIDPKKPIPAGRGRGYIRVRDNIWEFQGAYGGVPAQGNKLESINEFTVKKVLPDGTLVDFYVHSPVYVSTSSRTELDLLLETISNTVRELGIQPARPIYLDPLPPKISLDSVFISAKQNCVYRDGKWPCHSDSPNFLKVSIGLIDKPDECVQENFVVDFLTGDGHLWLVGASGSGKGLTLRTLFLSIALTHSPEQAHFYILDFSPDGLRGYEKFPHTGAYIRPHEQERVERFFGYLEDLLNDPLSESATRRPHVFVAINGFEEFRNTYPDLLDIVSQIARSGKSVGIHLIIASNRATEVNRTITSNIANRIVLRMGTLDEYYEILGRCPALLTIQSEGRGYSSLDVNAECQIAQPTWEGNPPIVIAEQMDKSWTGNRPRPINVLQERYDYNEVINTVITNDQFSEKGFRVLVGIEYDSLSPLVAEIKEDFPIWLVLGARQTGKSNFIMSFIRSLYALNPPKICVKALLLRRNSPIERISSGVEESQILKEDEAIAEEIAALLRLHQHTQEPPIFLVVDDLEGAFEPGREKVATALNELARYYYSLQAVYLIASTTREGIQPHVGAPIVRLFKQSRTGLCFSKDPLDLDWFGVGLSAQIRRFDLSFPGRGLFVERGRTFLVQVPKVI